MADYESLFGENLLSKEGLIPVSSLNGKYVAVYFSAHWCGNCRAFTPKLRQIYMGLKKQDAPFEVVFCSADKEEKGFTEYFASMPWLAVPFDNIAIRQQLNSLFEVSGIPRLVMVSPAGVINPDARGDVEANPSGFPWKQPTAMELIESYIKKGDTPVGSAAVQGKYFGLYFSAHWCSPCRQFTPYLIEVYNKLQAEGKNFEVIFCSMDNDEKEYQEYYGSMPWLTIGYQCPVVNKLKSVMGVQGIPTLVLFDTEGNTYTHEGYSVVKAAGPEGFPWLPKRVKDLNAEPDDINEKPCLVLFMDKECCSEESKQEKLAALKTVEEEMKMDMTLYYAKESGDVSSQIRGMLQNESCPLLSIVDIPDNGGYYIADTTTITAETITEFLQSFVNKTLERKQMVA